MALDSPSTDQLYPRRQLRRGRAHPPSPTNVVARWRPHVGDDGHAYDKLVVQWDYQPQHGTPHGGFMLHWRYPDEDSWTGPIRTYRQYVELCCVSMEEILVSVSARSVDDTFLPPEDGAFAVATPEPGLNARPAKPMGLTAELVDTRVLLKWEPVDFGGRVTYEVRWGSVQWETAQPIAETTLTQVFIDQYPGGDSAVPILVAARTTKGVYSTPATVTPNLSTLPFDSSVVRDETWTSGAWTGTHTNTVEDADGNLVLSDPLTNPSGTWVSAAVDLGVAFAGRMGVGFYNATMVNQGLTWGFARFAWRSGEAARRTWASGDEWYPEWLQRRTRMPWSAAEFQWNSLRARSMSWGAFADQTLSKTTRTRWSEARFTWQSRTAQGITWEGPVSSAGTAILVEVRHSADAITWTEWEPLGHTGQQLRYVQVRVTLTQPVRSLIPKVHRIRFLTYSTRQDEAPIDHLSETPGGIVDGFVTTFSLTVEPDAGSEILISDGVVLNPATDYTITGTTLEYLGGTQPSTWHRIHFRVTP